MSDSDREGRDLPVTDQQDCEALLFRRVQALRAENEQLRAKWEALLDAMREAAQTSQTQEEAATRHDDQQFWAGSRKALTILLEEFDAPLPR